MKFLIVGLGNPGAEYKNTRHNIGFDILRSISLEAECDFVSNKYGSLCKIKYKGKVLVLLLPNTFMNLSGKAVNYWLKAEKIEPSNLLIVTDDLALPYGKLRLRAKGSGGGHNGLKNISEILGNNLYPQWDNEQLIDLATNIDKAKKIIYSFCSIGIDLTMNNLN